MRTKLAALALAVLLATAGCSALAGTTNPSADATDGNANATQSAARQTVEVAATGQVEAEPNRAVVRVAVTSRGDDVETVRSQLAENTSAVRQALREAGIDAERITTERYDIRQNYRHRENPNEPKYQGQHALAVTLDDPSRAGEVIVTAVQNGATQVRDVRYTVDRETRLELREQALGDAVTNARGRAEVAADNAGLELAGVHTVRTVEVDVRPHRRQVATAAAGDGGGGATNVEGGTVTVTAQAVVIYNATDA